MHRVLYMLLDAAIAAIVLVPLFLLLDKYRFHNKNRTIGYILFAVYLSGMFAVVGLPDIRYIRFDPHFNFVPFAYMFSDFTNSFLNVLLFMPLGFFLPAFWRDYRKLWKTTLFGFTASVVIEILQIFTFRATDINDLITNTTGTLLGWCAARLMLRLFPAIKPGDESRDVFLVCGSAFSVMFFVQPFLANWIWIYL